MRNKTTNSLHLIRDKVTRKLEHMASQKMNRGTADDAVWDEARSRAVIVLAAVGMIMWGLLADLRLVELKR